MATRTVRYVCHHLGSCEHCTVYCTCTCTVHVPVCVKMYCTSELFMQCTMQVHVHVLAVVTGSNPVRGSSVFLFHCLPSDFALLAFPCFNAYTCTCTRLIMYSLHVASFIHLCLYIVHVSVQYLLSPSYTRQLCCRQLSTLTVAGNIASCMMQCCVVACCWQLLLMFRLQFYFVAGNCFQQQCCLMYGGLNTIPPSPPPILPPADHPGQWWSSQPRQNHETVHI